MAYKIKSKDRENWKRGMKKIRGMFQFESIPELKKDIAEQKKHPQEIFWNIEWGKKKDDEIREDLKELWGSVKDLRKIKGMKFFKPLTEAIKTMGLQKKKRKKGQ
jgi:hypothetical protein